MSWDAYDEHCERHETVDPDCAYCLEGEAERRADESGARRDDAAANAYDKANDR